MDFTYGEDLKFMHGESLEFTSHERALKFQIMILKFYAACVRAGNIKFCCVRIAQI
ncbi:hypothetical protein [uncultured Campylobacter sp.]|uniref:hypothetical protein n=1 Tax=uncultured Campylobacter sp. TaxID=218934 RepID=UPI00260E343C|nr:hypothetical protein [uncultured Campylobacter sp.]